MAKLLLAGTDFAESPSLKEVLQRVQGGLAGWASSRHRDDDNSLLLQIFGAQGSKASTPLQPSIRGTGLGPGFQILPGSSRNGLVAASTSHAPGGGGADIVLNAAWLQSAKAEQIEAELIATLGPAFAQRLQGGSGISSGAEDVSTGPLVAGADRQSPDFEGVANLVHELLSTGPLASPKPTVCRCPACSRLFVSSTSSSTDAALVTTPLGLDLTFKLHSNPTANQRIYLDFDGYDLASSEWENGGALRVGAFFGSPFSNAAKQAIQDIWRRVAEDFAPFNIDVTTEAPSSEDLKNTGAGDTRWGIRVAMTTNKNLLTNAPIKNAGGGGTAYLGSFNWDTDDVCLVFNGYNGTNADDIYAAAETVSHEVGHTLGLRHDGGSYGSNTNYYEGHGSGVISWGTIMGAPFINADENVTTWSKGEYIGANNKEDDLAIITGSASNAYVSGNGFTYRDDDYGNSLNTAYLLSGDAPSSFGIIERNTDVDWFRFSTASASVSINIRNACRVFSANGDGTFSTQYLDGLGPNLAISAQLFDANGLLIATSTPSDWLDAGFSLYLTTGVYYLSVEGVGLGNPLANPPSGFSDYGSIGQYLITSSITPGEPPISPVVITAISDNIGTITGPIADGATTDDTTPTISGTLFAALAPGSSVRVYRNDVYAGLATVTNTNWTYTPATALPSGTHRFKAAIFSSTSVPGPFSDSRSIVIDITAPTQTVTIASVSDNTDPVQGVVLAGGRTNDTTPTFTGTLSAALAADESLKLYNGVNFLVDADVSGTTWSATASLATDGSYTITARVVDSAGNQGPLSASRALILDTMAPTLAVAISNITDNVGTLQGSVADGAITNDTTPTLTGTFGGATAGAALAPGETLRINSNGAVAGNATVTVVAAGQSTWSYTPVTPLSINGLYSFTAQVIDGAGNLGPLSDPRTIVLDASAPTQTVTIASVSDNTDPVQGVVLAGGRTNDTTPTFTGTLSAALAADESLKLYNGVNFLVDADVSGITWSATASLATEGSYTITARVVDSAGNQGPLSASRALILDTMAPIQTVAITAISDNLGTITGLIADGAITNDTTPTLSGTLSAALASADVVRVYSNGALLAGNASVTVVAAGQSTWSYTPVTALSINGLYSFTAQVIDGAGNLGPLSDPRTIVLDASAPTQTVTIASVSDTTDPVQGVVLAGGRTNDTTPTFTGTLSAALAADESLKLYNGVNFLVDADVSGTTWSATASLATEGSYTITARVVDSAGNQGPLSASRALILDTMAPIQSVAITAISNNLGTITGLIADGAITNDTTPTLSGTLSAALASADVVRVYSNGALLAGNASVSGTTWSYTPVTALSINGLYSFTAQVIDGAGNLGPLSDPRTIVLDASAPTQTVTIASVSDTTDPVQGVVLAGGRTNDTTPTFTGTLSAALAADESLKLYNGVNFLVDADVSGTTWSATASLATEGSYTITARVVDSAGNQGPLSASRALILDTMAPIQSVAITAISDNLGTITGLIADGAITNDTTPTLSGTLSAALASADVVRVYSNGALLAGNASVSGTTWSYTPVTALSINGLYSFTAQVIDGAGNLGPLSDPRTIVLDASAPTQTVTIASVSDTTDPVQGVVLAGGRTNDTTPTFTGTLSAALAADESLKLYNGVNFLVDADVSGTTWSATASLATEGSYTITARVVDSAGNQGPLSASRALILDTMAPIQTVAITAISDNLGTITGLIADGAITNDTTPTLSGTLSAALASADVVRVYSNGALLAGNATVTVVAAGQSTWSYTPVTALSINGLYSFTAQVIDGAGNLGPLSDPRTIVLDASAPTQTVTIASVSDTTDPVQGVVLAGGRTNDTTPTFTGTLSAALAADESLKLYNGVNFLVDAEVSGTTWSATASLATDGSYTITARVVDSAGNQGPLSASRALILDTMAPIQTVAITAISDNLGTITGLIADGAITNDTTPTLSGTLSAALASADVVRVYSNGALLAGNASVSGTTWSYTPVTALSINGLYSFTAQVIDGAGNLGPLSDPRTIVLDAPISTPAQDTLTGIAASSDLYLLPQLNSSLLGPAAAPTYDTITSFEASDKLQVSGLTYNANLTASSGTAAGLDPSQLTAILPATWTANTARAFRVTGFNGTFVALNNSLAGFQSDQDAVLFLHSYNPSSTTPIGIL